MRAEGNRKKQEKRSPENDAKKEKRENTSDCLRVSGRKRVNRVKVIALLASGIGQAEIAKVVGCSTKSVQRISHEIQPAMEEIEHRLTEYRMQLHKHLPIPDRVAVLRDVAKTKKTNPFAALRAVAMANEIDGLVVQQRPDDNPPQHQPMFVLPPGARLQVNILPPKDQGTPAAGSAIDVTPKRGTAGGRQIGTGSNSGIVTGIVDANVNDNQ